ncbi:MAG: 2Fe-2S iron-sulfur cluster-binding protein [Gemmatimonadota bacterium]|jgi:sarcosine oxidase subunit alpha|nr:2Fe-2S iron-sulfur cluster-binding protein [Gemmatimonadaceae bacterium]
MAINGAAAELNIVVDDQRIRVAAGTTVAAALFNLGTAAFRRSVSGEPRGPVCGMGVCFECRVTIDSRPHQRACLIAVADGMHIRTATEA